MAEYSVVIEGRGMLSFAAFIGMIFKLTSLIFYLLYFHLDFKNLHLDHTKEISEPLPLQFFYSTLSYISDSKVTYWGNDDVVVSGVTAPTNDYLMAHSGDLFIHSSTCFLPRSDDW